MYATVIPISFINKPSAKGTVKIDKNNFETYFDVEISYSGFNNLSQISYKIEPKKQSITQESQSSAKISLTIAITFYRNNHASGTTAGTEYINMNLLKTRGYKINGTRSVDTPSEAKSYKTYISYAQGVIYN